jgi:hypothetical protein
LYSQVVVDRAQDGQKLVGAQLAVRSPGFCCPRDASNAREQSGATRALTSYGG